MARTNGSYRRGKSRLKCSVWEGVSTKLEIRNKHKTQNPNVRDECGGSKHLWIFGVRWLDTALDLGSPKRRKAASSQRSPQGSRPPARRRLLLFLAVVHHRFQFLGVPFYGKHDGSLLMPFGRCGGGGNDESLVGQTKSHR